MSIVKVGRYALKTKKVKKLLSAAQKLINKRLARKKYAKVYKSVDPYNIKAKTDIRWKDKQRSFSNGTR